MNKPNEQQPEAAKTKENNASNNQSASAQISPPKTFTKTKLNNGLVAKATPMLAGIAVAIAIIGSGVAIGFTLWKTEGYNYQSDRQNQLITEQLNKQQHQFQQWVKEASDQHTLLQNQLVTEQTQVKQLADLVTTLQASQKNLTSQLSQVNADSSQTWMLFEAKQLLKQAFLRLRVTDINGASKLLEDVNNTIKQRGDLSQTASQINQALDNALLKLQQVVPVDRAALYSELAAVQERITQLESKKPIFQVEQEHQNQDASRWQKLSTKLSGYVRVDFNANSKLLPLLTAQGVGQLKMALSLAIEKAQWAALNGESNIYVAELERTVQLLTQYFDDKSTEVKAVVDKINDLKNRPIVLKIPDISDTLVLVNNYLDEQINLNNVTKKTGGESK